MKNLKTASLIAAAQAVAYGLICINIRAVAQVDYAAALGSDLLIASLNFLIIRKVAKEIESAPIFIGYVTGSLIGTAAGIYASTHITP